MNQNELKWNFKKKGTDAANLDFNIKFVSGHVYNTFGYVK